MERVGLKKRFSLFIYFVQVQVHYVYKSKERELSVVYEILMPTFLC